MKGWTYGRTDVHDVMAIKPNFITSIGYHIFLAVVLSAREGARGAPLKMTYDVATSVKLSYRPLDWSHDFFFFTSEKLSHQPFDWLILC